MSGVLKVRGLAKRYGELAALADVDIDVPPGRVVGFLGPNGAGKTTAMRCIMGLADPDAGDLSWQGRPLDRQVRLGFGYMPEERGLYPRMRLREQLVHFARLSGLTTPAARGAAEQWLTRFGLADRASSRLEELSHGNQQRVQLAVALVHHPVLAVLDEPFSGLDPIAVETMAASLRDMAAAGTAVLFSSHQLDLVEDVCQDVVIVDHGRVVLAGDLETLRERAIHRVLEITVDGRSWCPDAGAVEIVDRGGRGRYLVDRDLPLDEVLRAASRTGHVESFSFEPPSLSDLFREAVAA